MPFVVTSYIFYTTDIIYMVAVLSPEMGFTLNLSVCVYMCVFMYPMHTAIHISIHSTIYLYPYPSIHPFIFLYFQYHIQ
jgi:hypothetical protein